MAIDKTIFGFIQDAASAVERYFNQSVRELGQEYVPLRFVACSATFDPMRDAFRLRITASLPNSVPFGSSKAFVVETFISRLELATCPDRGGLFRAAVDRVVLHLARSARSEMYDAYDEASDSLEEALNVLCLSDLEASTLRRQEIRSSLSAFDGFSAEGVRAGRSPLGSPVTVGSSEIGRRRPRQTTFPESIVQSVAQKQREVRDHFRGLPEPSWRKASKKSDIGVTSVALVKLYPEE